MITDAHAYLIERVKLLTLAKHNIIILFYNEILQTCNFVDSCLNYRFSLAFMWIPDCDDSSICLRQKDFIDDSKMSHELYNVIILLTYLQLLLNCWQTLAIISVLPCSPLASYNSLQDKHLAGYFSNSRMKRHLKRSGLVRFYVIS